MTRGVSRRCGMYLADTAVHDVDLMHGFITVDNDLARTEHEADDVHAQFA